MHLKNVPNERRQTQKVTVVWLHLRKTPRIGKSMETESNCGCQELGGGGVGGIGSDCLMGMGFSFGVMKIFWNQIAVTVTQHCERT